MKKLSTNQKRKLAAEMGSIIISLIGIVICVCNFFKIVPENNDVVMAIIAYGALIGPTMISLGMGSFLEIRNTKLSKFSKKAR